MYVAIVALARFAPPAKPAVADKTPVLLNVKVTGGVVTLTASLPNGEKYEARATDVTYAGASGILCLKGSPDAPVVLRRLNGRSEAVDECQGQVVELLTDGRGINVTGTRPPSGRPR